MAPLYTFPFRAQKSAYAINPRYCHPIISLLPCSNTVSSCHTGVRALYLVLVAVHVSLVHFSSEVGLTFSYKKQLQPQRPDADYKRA